MSATAEELITELSAALNSGDLDRAVGLTHPDVVQYGTVGGMDQDLVLRGQAAVLDYWDDVGETWASLTYEPERIISSDAVIVVFWRETARSSRSDLEVETQTAAVFKVRDRKIVEIRGYMDREEAIRAAGLES